jgi:predicted nucleic acid-binding Zn ribbon protein
VSFRINTCAVCGEPMPQPPTGRPRMYCSGRCRVRAQRRRLAAAAAAQWQPVAADVPDITAADLACLETSDPDEAVMKSVMRAALVAVHPVDFEVMTFRSRRLPVFTYALITACDELARLDPTQTAEQHRSRLLAKGERTFRAERSA